MPVEKYHDTVDFKWNIEVKCWGVCVYVGVCGCVCVVCTLLFGLLVAVHAAKVTGRNTMMRTMTQTNTLKLREGETGRRCHGDDLLSATASHSSRLRSNWLWNEGGREVEEGPLVKRRVNELSLLSRIWPLNKSAMFVLTHVCLFATWAFDFLFWAARSSLQAHSNLPELTNLWAEHSQPVFTSSHVTGAALRFWKWSGSRGKILLLLLYQIFIIQSNDYVLWTARVPQLPIKMTRIHSKTWIQAQGSWRL